MPASRCSSIRDERSGRGWHAWLRRWLDLPFTRDAGGPTSSFAPTIAGNELDSGVPSRHSASLLSSQRIGPASFPCSSRQLHSPGVIDPRSRMMALLERREGASVAEIAEVTGWQAHSVRAALSGLRKRGVVIERIGRDGRACRHRAVVVAGLGFAGTSALASADPFGAAAPSSDVLPSDVLRPPDMALTASVSPDCPEGAA